MSGMAPSVDWGWSASNAVEKLGRRVAALEKENAELRERVAKLEEDLDNAGEMLMGEDI